MSNNRIILAGCINTFKEANQIDLKESDLFEVFSLVQVNKDKNITFENIQSSIVDGGNDGGIDSIMVFIDDEFVENIDDLEDFKFTKKSTGRFIITQCKKENSFKESCLDKLITTIPILLDLEKSDVALLSRFNSDLVEQALLLIELWKKVAIYGGDIILEFNYITNAPEIIFNSSFEDKKSQLIEITKKALSSPSVTFELFSSSELLTLYQKQKVSRLTIEFKERPLLTEYENRGIGYIGTVKLGEYKRFLTSDDGNIREDLFESNIRHYQGLVDVNKKIKLSVDSITREDFWWLNNGITIIAEEPKEIGKKLSIENIQIVNGLQTSYSIFNNYGKNDNDHRSVLVKVIINNNKEIIDNIIDSTNSQSPVSPTLLRATEPIQRDIELFFFNEGFYYDRRKNYYKNLGKPATKIFSIQVTAQVIEAIVFDNPHIARSRPTTLLKNEVNYKKIFDYKKDFKGFLNCCLINNKTHSFWLKFNDIALKSKTANFKLHLSCVLVKMYFSSRYVNFEDLTALDINSLDIGIFEESIKFLSENIDRFLSENSGTNLVNIAKSKDFTEYLFKKVEDNFVASA